MKQYNNLCLVLLCLVLTACANNIRRADPIDIVIPSSPRKVVNITVDMQVEYDIAINYLKENKIVKAQKILESMADKYAGISGVYLNLALLYYHRGDYESSRKQLDKVMKISADNPLAYNLSGTLYRNEGRFKLARRAYATAIKLAPDYANAHLNMAILFDIYLQYWENAKQHYLIYLKLVSTDSQQVKDWLNDVELRLSRG